MLMLMQQQATEQQIQIAQETVIAIIVASTVVVLGLLWLIGRFASVAPASEGPLRYGNFFVVIFGIMTVLIGFLVAFPLVVSNVFTDPTQVIALLSALFGTIVGLVGTYFGVKSSSDASDRAQDLTQHAQELATTVSQGSNVLPGGSGPLGGQPDGQPGGQPGERPEQTVRDSPSQEESERNR